MIFSLVRDCSLVPARHFDATTSFLISSVRSAQAIPYPLLSPVVHMGAPRRSLMLEPFHDTSPSTDHTEFVRPQHTCDGMTPCGRRGDMFACTIMLGAGWFCQPRTMRSTCDAFQLVFASELLERALGGLTRPEKYQEMV